MNLQIDVLYLFNISEYKAMLIKLLIYHINRCMYIYMCVYVCTVGTESIQTPLHFSLFVILQPFAKII